MRNTLMALMASCAATCLIAAPALAEEGRPLRYADLDLSTPEGKAKLDKRIAVIARKICASHVLTGTRILAPDCRRHVREEVLAKIDERDTQLGKGG